MPFLTVLNPMRLLKKAGGAGIVFRPSSTTSAQGTTSVTLTIPNTVHVGDLMVAVFGTYNGSFTTPSGWNAVSGSPTGPNSNMEISVFWRFATSGDITGSTTVACTGGATFSCAVMGAWSGVNATPVNASVVHNSNATTSNFTTFTVTTTTPNTLILTCVGSSPQAGGAFTLTIASGGSTIDVSRFVAGNGGMIISELAQAATGASTAQTISAGGTNQAYASFTIALAPA